MYILEGVCVSLGSRQGFSQDLRIRCSKLHIWGELDVQFFVIPLHYTQKIRILGCPKSAIGCPKDTHTPLWLKTWFQDCKLSLCLFQLFLSPSLNRSKSFLCMKSNILLSCYGCSVDGIPIPLHDVWNKDTLSVSVSPLLRTCLDLFLSWHFSPYLHVYSRLCIMGILINRNFVLCGHVSAC